MTSTTGNAGYFQVIPTSDEWAQIPQRFPRRGMQLISLLITLATTAVIFFTFNHWDDLDEPSFQGLYRRIDM